MLVASLRREISWTSHYQCSLNRCGRVCVCGSERDLKRKTQITKRTSRVCTNLVHNMFQER